MKLIELHDMCNKAKIKTHGWVGAGETAQFNCRCGGPAMCRHCLLESMAPLVKRLAHSSKLTDGDKEEDIR